MGIFDKLMGGAKDYPSLDAGSAAARKLKAAQAPLEEFAKKVKDPLEVVPADGKTYVFIGKPPKVFGVVWIDSGKLMNFKAIAEEKKLSPADFQAISDRMRDAYIRSEAAERYSAMIGGRKLTIIPSEQLGGEMEQIVSELA